MDRITDARTGFLGDNHGRPIFGTERSRVVDDESRVRPSRERPVGQITVLIADDSPAAVNGLQGILRAYPDITLVGDVTNGAEAVSRAQDLRPDVILMDAQKPGMDGVEATRRIKQALPDTKVLFMAVHATHIAAAMDAGADDYLMKDSSRQALLEAIKRLGRQARQSRTQLGPRT
jgi:DNA-binding NarL/FixJ family response regulator